MASGRDQGDTSASLHRSGAQSGWLVLTCLPGGSKAPGAPSVDSAAARHDSHIVLVALLDRLLPVAEELHEMVIHNPFSRGKPGNPSTPIPGHLGRHSSSSSSSPPQPKP